MARGRAEASGRTNFVSAMRGFHGRTMGAVSATYTPKYREAFQPLIPGFDYVPYITMCVF